MEYDISLSELTTFEDEDQDRIKAQNSLILTHCLWLLSENSVANIGNRLGRLKTLNRKNERFSTKFLEFGFQEHREDCNQIFIFMNEELKMVWYRRI